MNVELNLIADSVIDDFLSSSGPGPYQSFYNVLAFVTLGHRT